MKNQKKRRDPVKVMLAWTLVLALVAAGAWVLGNSITTYRSALLASMQKEVEDINTQRDQEYMKALAEFEAATQTGENLLWPDPVGQGWEVVDLSTYPLENVSVSTVSRTDIMNNGMLLVNEWHSRPEDFIEESLVSVGTYSDGKIAVDNYNIELFPVVIDALQVALTDAKTLGYENYIVRGGYRSWDAQNELFNKYMEKYSQNYSGDALIERTKRDVNYPGTSEFNSGLTFTLDLYKRGDAAVNNANYVETAEGIWFSENCWKYGFVFRFPKSDYPTKGTQDKSYKTGVHVSLEAYRYVGKGNAAVMNLFDFCLEEYVEYLQEHPHIAVYEDGVLRYEIVRQYVGDDVDPIQVEITNKAANYVSSLDNMGAVITVFEY